MKTIEVWFKESIEQYASFTAKTVELRKNIDSLPLDQIIRRCASIKELREEIDERDKKLHEIMAFIGPEVLDNPMTGQYQRTLDLAIRETDLVGERANRHKMLLLQELTPKKDITGYLNEINEDDSVIQIRI